MSGAVIGMPDELIVDSFAGGGGGRAVAAPAQKQRCKHHQR